MLYFQMQEDIGRGTLCPQWDIDRGTLSVQSVQKLQKRAVPKAYLSIHSVFRMSRETLLETLSGIEQMSSLYFQIGD